MIWTYPPTKFEPTPGSNITITHENIGFSGEQFAVVTTCDPSKDNCVKLCMNGLPEKARVEKVIIRKSPSFPHDSRGCFVKTIELLHKTSGVEVIDCGVDALEGDPYHEYPPRFRREGLDSVYPRWYFVHGGGVWLRLHLQFADTTGKIYLGPVEVEVTFHPVEYCGEISVMTYGAKGNGLEDDTDAIRAAINAANGATVRFPPGQYRVTETITVPAGTHIKGSGRGVSPFIKGLILPATGAVLLANPGIVCLSILGYNVTIQDLAIYFGDDPAPGDPSANVGIKLGDHFEGAPRISENHGFVRPFDFRTGEVPRGHSPVPAPNVEGYVWGSNYIAWVVLERLEIIASGGGASGGSGSGVLSLGSGACVMRNCHVEGFKNGVYLKEPYCCPPNSWEIDGCWIKCCMVGVVFSGETYIHDSQIEGNVVGVMDELYHEEGKPHEETRASFAALRSCRNHYENNGAAESLPTAQILLRYNNGLPHQSVNDMFSSSTATKKIVSDTENGVNNTKWAVPYSNNEPLFGPSGLNGLPCLDIAIDPRAREGEDRKEEWDWNRGQTHIDVIGGWLNSGILVDNGRVRLTGCDGAGSNARNMHFVFDKSKGVVWQVLGRTRSVTEVVRNLNFPGDVQACDEFVGVSGIWWFNQSDPNDASRSIKVKVGRDGHNLLPVKPRTIIEQLRPDPGKKTVSVPTLRIKKIGTPLSDPSPCLSCPEVPACAYYTQPVKVEEVKVGDTVEIGFSHVLPPGAFLVGAVTKSATATSKGEVTILLFNRSGEDLELPVDRWFQVTVWKDQYADDQCTK
jgi:hypothetical protein